MFREKKLKNENLILIKTAAASVVVVWCGVV